MSDTKQLPVKQKEVTELDAAARLVVLGDLSKLTDEQKTLYYMEKCRINGLPWQIQPYDYLELNGKTKLYLNKVGCSYLAKEHCITTEIVEACEVLDGKAYKVMVRATDGEGRSEVASKYIALEVQKFNWKEGTKKDGGKYKFKEMLENPDGTPVMRPVTLQERLDIYMKCETQAKNRAIKALTGEGGIDDDENAGLGAPTSIGIDEAIRNEALERVGARKLAEGKVLVTEVDADTTTGEVRSYEAEPVPATLAERYKEEAAVAAEQGQSEIAEKKAALAKATKLEISKLHGHSLKAGFKPAEINAELQKQFGTLDIDTDQLAAAYAWVEANRRK